MLRMITHPSRPFESLSQSARISASRVYISELCGAYLCVARVYLCVTRVYLCVARVYLCVARLSLRVARVYLCVACDDDCGDKLRRGWGLTSPGLGKNMGL